MININKEDNDRSVLPQTSINLNSDRDSGENKYKKRPLFEWLGKLLK